MKGILSLLDESFTEEGYSSWCRIRKVQVCVLNSPCKQSSLY